MITKRLFLLDAMALIYRAYYALNKNPRLTSNGINTSAILGFTNTLYDVLKNEKPSHIGVVFDSHAPTLRVMDYSNYKANRQATPDDIISALPHIKQIIKAFGIPILKLDGYEADDIIGTIACKASDAGFEVLMMTSDKDFGQLLNENIHFYKPAKMGEKAKVVKAEEFCAKYEIKEPKQFIDILGLWGDAVDNIPGIPGVGEVTAKKLVAQFGSIENMIANVHEISNEKLRQKVIDHTEQALMSKKLATIILDVPVEFEEEKLKYENINLPELKKLFQELEFRTLANRIFTDFSVTPPPASEGKQAAMIFSDGEMNLFSELDDSESFQSSSMYQKLNEKSCNYTLQKSPDALVEQLKKLENSGKFAFICTGMDVSVVDAEPIGIAFSSQKNEAFYLPIYGNEFRENIIPILIDFFTNSKAEKICYDLKSNFTRFKKVGIPFPENCHDLMLAHYIIQPETRHGFDYLCQTFLKYEPKNIEELFDVKKHNLQQLSTNLADSVKTDLCEKADLVLQLSEKILTDIKNNPAYDLYSQVEIPLSEAICEMEFAGVSIDKTALNQFSGTLQKEIESIQHQIFELAGETFNIASPKQLGEILFEKILVDSKAKLTKTKQYQTGEDVLQKLIDKHPIIPLILEFRGLTKLKSTYVDPLPLLINPKTNRIHATFNQAVTSTGRLSSTNPNLQNLPIRSEKGKEIRKAIIPSNSDYLILSADYSQIELRIIASLSGDKNMCEAFNSGMDIHRATAAKVFDLNPEDVTTDMRRKAKAVNFGIIYGISSFGLAEQLGISRKEAGILIEAYFEKYPDVKKFMEHQVLMAKQLGYVETIMHRRRYLTDINSSNSIVRNFAERNAVNAPIQGSAADMIKVAMVSVFQEFVKQNLKSKIVIQVHDELVIEVFKSEIDLVKEIVMTEMKNALPLSVPVDVQIEVGNNWIEAH